MKLKNQFAVRCHAISQIMSEPKKKENIFSQTCLTHIASWLKMQPEFYGRRSKNISSKYLIKGIKQEDAAIEFAAKFLKWGNVTKNTERRHGGWLEGEADVVLTDSIEDIKNSWDEDTFPLFATESPTKGYWWQLQGYCELWDKDKAGVVYTLMDAPDDLIEREARRQSFELGFDELEEDFYQEIRKTMTFEHYPPELRIKRFAVARDTIAIGQVYSKVMQIRRYIEALPEIDTLITLHSDDVID